jgi:hypothetical protein
LAMSSSLAKPENIFLGTRNSCSWVMNIVLESGFVPGQACVLVGVRIAIAFGRTGRASNQTVQRRPDAIFGAEANHMAGSAAGEDHFAATEFCALAAGMSANSAIVTTVSPPSCLRDAPAVRV